MTFTELSCELPDHAEMRDRSEDMKNQLAGGRVRVDPFLQAEQGNAALLEPTAAAKQLGLGRSTVYREVNRAGIERHPAGARSLETAVGFASGELDA
jgi:transcriptional regulator of acetoin/glycerol metabolism